MTTRRVFAAVVPPEDALEHLEAFLEPRRGEPGLRWVLPEHLHLTLAFFAAVPDGALDDLLERLADAARRRTSFGARVAGGGAFPDVASARVVWAGLDVDGDGRRELDLLAAGARAAAARPGVAVDGGRFRPHVTLARVRRPTELSRWVRLLDGYSGPAWEVDHVAVVESFLGQGPRGRPRYETIDTVPLSQRRRR